MINISALVLFSYVFLGTNMNTKANIIFINTPFATWQEAEDYCQSNLGTHLATITSLTSNITQQLLPLAGNRGIAWIGLRDINSDETYQWIDGTVCTESTSLCSSLWARNQPSILINDCVAITGRGQLIVIPCTLRIFFFCNVPVPITTPSPIKTCCGCTEPNPSNAGCMDPVCEYKICASDKACCNIHRGVGWDELCAMEAEAICLQTLQPTSPTISPTTDTPTISPTTDSPTISPTECPRHRKPWHQLTESQRNLYINGILELSTMGRLQIFTETHANRVTSAQAHETSAFLPWHRYFIWELETQIRSIGAEYECFSLPYWDWAFEVEQNGLNYDQYNILNTGLSGRGNSSDGGCINDGSVWSKNNGYIPFDCAKQGNDGQCCLSRFVCDNNGDGCNIASYSDMIGNIVLWEVYGADIGRADIINPGFRESLETESHAPAHNTMGGGGHLGDALSSPDDPIFYLLHSYVDYNWALWQDCMDFDLFQKNNIHNDIYLGTISGDRRTGVGGSDIDDTLLFTELAAQSWSYIGRNPQTCRDMHSLSDWAVSYEKGSFWNYAHVDNVCDNINPQWFYDENIRRRRRERRLLSMNEKGFGDDIYVRLNKSLKTQSKNDKKKLMRKWKKMNCEYVHFENECERPKYFDDCNDMERGDNGDIDISLNELIEKVSDYKCMIATREKYYDWALKTRTLYRLCRGDFDTFCDKQFIHEIGDDQCELKENRKRYKQQQQEEEQMNRYNSYDEDVYDIYNNY